MLTRHSQNISARIEMPRSQESPLFLMPVVRETHHALHAKHTYRSLKHVMQKTLANHDFTDD